jgi:predicted enzyme related to lactoylglutathione lyase
MATTSATKVKGIHASYYTVKDFDRALDFYRALLGEEPSFSQPGAFAEWTFPTGETFGIYRTDEWTPHGGLLFGVDDIKASVADNRARGVKFDDDGKVDDNGHCYMAFGEDSEGNTFILHQLK